MLRDVAEGRGTGLSAMPQTLQLLIASRLDSLLPEEKAVLQDAAVVGKVFWTGGIASMSGLPEEEVERRLDEAVRREFVRPVRGSSVAGQREYAFLHALVQDVAYGQIPRATRADRHVAAAAWIREVAGDRVSVGRGPRAPLRRGARAGPDEWARSGRARGPHRQRAHDGRRPGEAPGSGAGAALLPPGARDAARRRPRTRPRARRGRGGGGGPRAVRGVPSGFRPRDRGGEDALRPAGAGGGARASGALGAGPRRDRRAMLQEAIEVLETQEQDPSSPGRTRRWPGTGTSRGRTGRRSHGRIRRSPSPTSSGWRGRPSSRCSIGAPRARRPATAAGSRTCARRSGGARARSRDRDVDRLQQPGLPAVVLGGSRGGPARLGRDGVVLSCPRLPDDGAVRPGGRARVDVRRGGLGPGAPDRAGDARVGPRALGPPA